MRHINPSIGKVIDRSRVLLVAAGFVIIASLLTSLTPISQAVGTTYYVSPSGDDGAIGTSPSSAWKSINAVNGRVFTPGDSILFEGGQTFSGTLTFDAADAGTATAPVTVSSYGSGQATINGGAGLSISVYNAGGFVITNLKLVGSGRTTNSSDGVNITNGLPNNAKLDFIRLDNLEISGFGRQGILVMGASGKSGFRDVRITNISTHDNGHSGMYILGQFSRTATGYAHENVYVGHVTAYNNSGESGLSYNTGSGIVLSDVNNGTIEYSVAYNNGFLNTANGGPIGIWAWDSNNILIQHNESHHNRTASATDGGGFDLDGGTTNSIMQYNYSHDNDGAGFLLGQFSGARPFSGNTVRYNISEKDGRKNGFAGIQLWNGGSGVKNSDIYNNTVYINKPASGAPRAVRVQSATTNIRIRNNILVSANGVRLVEVVSGQSGLLFQGNEYWSSGSSFSIRWYGVNYSSLSAWRNATGQEKIGSTSTGLSVDPKLTSPGNGGTIGNADLLSTLSAYRLLASSPLIDAGLNLQSQFGINPGLHDFYNNSIPQGSQFDVGAHEFVNSSLPDSTPPTITITAPTSGMSVSGLVALNASASDNVGVAGVRFSIDGVNLGAEDTVAPYSISWDTTQSVNGSHSVGAVARDAAGLTALSNPVTVTVNNPALGNGAPTGVLPAGTTSTTLGVSSALSATCKWGTVAGTSYADLPNLFSITGGVAHSTVVGSLSNGNTYNFYVRCQDLSGNTNVSDFIISFSVASSTLSNLVAAYPFSEGSGTTTVDVSGNNQTATLVGATWTSGKFGQGLAFNGSNQYVKGTDIDFPSGPFTLSGWFKTGVVGPSLILSKYLSSTNQIYVVVRDNGRIVAGFYDGTQWQEVLTLQSHADDRWHHFAMVVTTSTLELFLDGVGQGSDTHDNSLPVNNVIWNIGRAANNTRYFQGSLDEIRFYNKALSLAEVAIDMNTALGGSSSSSTQAPASTVSATNVSDSSDVSFSSVITTLGRATQLLVNPSFENGGTAWTSARDGGSAIVTTEFRSPTKSLQMTASNLYPRAVHQDLSVRGGQPYTASAWIKASGIAANGVRVELIWLNTPTTAAWLPAGNVIRTEVLGPVSSGSFFSRLLNIEDLLAAVRGTSGWSQVFGNFVAPANAVQLRIRLHVEIDQDNVGTAWFDDLVVTQK